MAAKSWARSSAASFWQRVILREPRAAAGLALIVTVAAILVVAGVGAVATVRIPQSMRIEGYAGHLGEWELTAVVSKNDSRAASDLAGAMKMKHVGYCSSDGPEVKTGAMQVRMSRLSSSVEVKLQIDGIECTHSGDLSDAYIGTLVCPGRKAVPLTLWIR
ncbi:MAG: hypothetical protein ABL907_23970 [Hyphomicrobium sp.]